MQKKGELFNTQSLVKMGILGAMAFVIMKALELPLPIFLAFLKIDFGDIPAVIATLIIHPLAGIVVVTIKNLLALMASSSGGVGEIVNWVVGVSFILPIGLVTRKSYKLSYVFGGCMIGIITMTIAAVLTNAFITLPLYGEAACIEAGHELLPAIHNKWTLLLYQFVPFNLIKGTAVAAISVIVVKGMQPIVKHLRVKNA